MGGRVIRCAMKSEKKAIAMWELHEDSFHTLVLNHDSHKESLCTSPEDSSCNSPTHTGGYRWNIWVCVTFDQNHYNC